MKLAPEKMVRGHKYRITYRLHEQESDRVMVARYVDSTAHSPQRFGPIQYRLDGQGAFPPAQLSALEIKAVIEVPIATECYAAKRAGEVEDDDLCHVDMEATVNVRALIMIAGCLLSEPDDPNPEYDRALTELTCDAAGLPMKHLSTIEEMIRDARSFSQIR